MTIHLTRRPDWQDQLTQLVVERMRTPFAWGTHDCVTFAAEAVRRMTGEEILPFEARWRTAREAYRVLRGYCGLAPAVASTGLPALDPRHASRGDLMLMRTPGRPGSMRGALGICLGDRIAAPGLHGLVMPSLREGVLAWRV